MTLDEIRTQIDAVDTQMKPLFLKRMECAAHVAEEKKKTGGDVFVLERELAIIEKRASDVDPSVYDEYVAFLRHLMSVSRRYQYGILSEMQETVLTEALQNAGLDEMTEHNQVRIRYQCKKEASDLNLFINMTKLNKIAIDSMNLETKEGIQIVTMVLDGCIREFAMRRLLFQIAKESEEFTILGLN